MADQNSVEILAFNIASRTFAYLLLPQGHSRSLISFSSFKKEYLDQVIRAENCDQFVGDIRIATHNAEELTNLREVSQCVREPCLTKCHFGSKEVDFLGRTVSPEGIAPKHTKSKTTSKNCGFQKQRRVSRDTFDLLTTTVITYPDSLRKLHLSITWSMLTKQSKSLKTSSQRLRASTRLWTSHVAYG